MREKRSEKSEMYSVEWASQIVRQEAVHSGNVKSDISRMARRLGWSYSRAKSVWYADPRVSLRASELVELERLAGIRNGQRELSENDRLIARAQALLDGGGTGPDRALAAALRAILGGGNSPGD